MSEHTPRRIQRKRSKGWRMPPDAVYVGRPTRWGNPFRVGVDGTAEECVALFAKWFNADVAPVGSELYEFRRKHGWLGFELACVVKHHLAGKDLACWCAEGQPCHADVLLRLANG